MDLLLRASHDDYTFDFKAAKIKIKFGKIKNMKIKIKSGQIFIFKKSLAEDWGWSRHKVSNFLNGLAGNNGKIREKDASQNKITFLFRKGTLKGRKVGRIWYSRGFHISKMMSQNRKLKELKNKFETREK
ncbi:unnamed protein product [marine sediment metagenome]|uniref:Uncharacterized protein n=1 Tax=marine sediment metagenome TaxID=412755 RepID=X1QEL4_9ZZZZ